MTTQEIQESETKPESKNQETKPQFVPDLNINKFIEYCHSLSGKKSDYVSYKKYLDASLTELNKKQKTKIKLAVYNIQIVYCEHKYTINLISNSDENIFKSYQAFINGYYLYQQNYYIVNDQLINTIYEDKIVLFDLYQIAELLKCSKRTYLASYYGKNYNIYIKVINKRKYTNSDGLREILSKSRKISCKAFMEQIGLNTVTKIQSHEAQLLEQVVDFLEDKSSKIDYETQYPVGSYFVDMYIPKYKIAIEIDEKGHSDRDAVYEQNREDYIKKHLTTKLLRINPHGTNFRMAKELGTLNRLLMM